MTLLEFQALFDTHSRKSVPYVEIEGEFEGRPFSGFLVKYPGKRLVGLCLQVLFRENVGWLISERRQDDISEELLERLPSPVKGGWNLGSNHDCSVFSGVRAKVTNLFLTPLNS